MDSQGRTSEPDGVAGQPLQPVDGGKLSESNPALGAELVESKRTEEQLKLFRVLIDHSSDGIFVIDPGTGRFLDANERAHRALGYTRDELLALTVFDVTAGVDRAIFDGNNARLKQTGTAMVEALNRRKDGVTYPVEVSLSFVTLDREYLLAVVRDITERKRLEESHARLAMAVEQADESVMITDTQGTMVYVNPAFEKNSGYSRAEALGQNPSILKSGKQDASFYRQMWDMLRSGGVWHGHFSNKRKDGTLYEEEATISAVRDLQGEVVNYVAVKRDVTRELQLEALYRQAQKMESIGQFAGGIAHDFNNILAAMMMQAELSGMAENIPKAVQEGLVAILASAERAANLTRQLLLFSRRQVMQPRQLDLNEVVNSLAKMLRRILREDVRLELELHGKPLVTHADAGMLDQVLMNLTVNARDAMPQGGRLIIETSERDFDAGQAALIPGASPGRFVWLSVSDTGCGIPPEIQSRIFEPFFTTKEAGKGTGLGLSTVFGIVKQHEGWLKVYSEVGKGTTFQIFLPASDASAEVQAKDAAKPKPRGGSETILLAEDDEYLRMMTQTVLERNGYQVLEALDGVDAQRVWTEQKSRISMLLTDLVMPGGVSGRELAARLQAERPKLKVIFTSGYSSGIVGRELKLKAGQGFVQKPCPPDKLLKAVRDCLDGSPP